MIFTSVFLKKNCEIDLHNNSVPSVGIVSFGKKSRQLECESSSIFGNISICMSQCPTGHIIILPFHTISYDIIRYHNASELMRYDEPICIVVKDTTAHYH